MKIYLNRKQNSARVISVFLLQSFRIEYKLLCKKKFTSLSHLNEVIFSCIYFYMFNVLPPPFPLPYLLSLKPYFLDLSFKHLMILKRTLICTPFCTPFCTPMGCIFSCTPLLYVLCSTPFPLPYLLSLKP